MITTDRHGQDFRERNAESIDSACLSVMGNPLQSTGDGHSLARNIIILHSTVVSNQNSRFLLAVLSVKLTMTAENSVEKIGKKLNIRLIVVHTTEKK